MTFTTEFWVQILVYLASFAATAGSFREKLKNIECNQNRLEAKQEKHNKLIERMALAEQSIKTAHNRIDKVYDAGNKSNGNSKEE